MKTSINTTMKTSINTTYNVNYPRIMDTDSACVDKAHKRLLEYIASINTGLHTPYCDAVLTLGVQSPRASAYLPLLLAEPFQINEPFIVNEAAFANLCLDVFSRAVDCCTDNPKGSDPILIHLGSLCMGKAVQVYGNLLPRGDGFWKYWEQYLKEASLSEQFLWRHRGSFVPFGEDDFAMQGTKSSLIKVSAALYASLTNRWGILDEIEIGLNAIATGVQIIDDLLDWEEDLGARIYTFPLVLGQRNRIRGQSLAQSVNSPYVVTVVLRTAMDNLEIGKQHFEKVNASSMVSFIDALLRSIREAEVYVERLPDCKVKDCETFVIRHLHRIISPRLAH